MPLVIYSASKMMDKILLVIHEFQNFNYTLKKMKILLFFAWIVTLFWYLEKQFKCKMLQKFLEHVSWLKYEL